MKAENVLHQYVAAFVDGLSTTGVRHACIAPGSRSTPLAMLLEAHPHIKVWMHLDERSCAFFALGLAKEGRRPVAVLCTSGTAAANFLPAAVEALHARIPLLLLTADRPPELQGVGANQTINQVELFGKQVKWFCQASLPDTLPNPAAYARSLACQSVSWAVSQPPGPVHLNFPFREPLVPVAEKAPVASRLVEEALGEPWNQSAANQSSFPVVTNISMGTIEPEAATIENLASALAECTAGLIVCGPQPDPVFPKAVTDLARSLHFPILADPLSQVRCGSHDRSFVVDTYDAFLRESQAADLASADVVLRFGSMPRSKPLSEYLQRQDCRQVLISSAPPAPDPVRTATDIIYADPSGFCLSLTERFYRFMDRRPYGGRETPWLVLNQRSRQAISDHFESLDELFEGKVFAQLEALLPENAILFVGNSMPVRDLETFFPSSDKKIRFLANHGASGIDGVTSTALGCAAVAGLPTILVTGDLSFYHDLNGLLPAKLHGLNLTVVLLNNDGGGIFSFLLQAAREAQFETLFGTPHGLDFEPAVQMFCGSYRLITDWSSLRDAFTQSHLGLRVLELRTDRKRNVELHREVWEAVASQSVRGRPAVANAEPGALS